MYSKSAWGGNIDPFIHFNMIAQPDSMNKVPLIIYEYKDVRLIGHEDLDEFGLSTMHYICDDDAVQKQFCNDTQKYEFILAPNATSKSMNPIFTEAIPLNDPKPIKYPISRTGYYCVLTWDMGTGEYTAVAEFRNAFGELPAAQIAKLPFYGGLTLVYAVLGIFWAFLYVQNRHDILPVQNYITAILVFLVVEMLLTWGYYDYQNVHGVNVGTRIYLVIVSILNAGRNSFSFFLLLIVCLGYGVVKPSLGKTMVYVRWLAAAHFAFGVIYSTASLTIHPEDAGPVILLIIMPLSATLTAFYIWTLNGLGMTMKDLMERKQHVKAGMYRKLWWCILTTILVIFAFFFFNSFTFVGVSEDSFAPSHWQTRWFILDGWLNVVYLADVSFVAYLWRPTANNRRFAMSDEVSHAQEAFVAMSPSYTDLIPRSHKMMRASISPSEIALTVWTISKTAMQKLSTRLHLRIAIRTMAMAPVASARILRHQAQHHQAIVEQRVQLTTADLAGRRVHCLHRYPRNPQVYLGSRLTEKPSLPWARMTTNGAMTKMERNKRGWSRRKTDLVSNSHFRFSTSFNRCS